MNIDYAFILAAGLGTRMGELGKIIPKPLWPVFEKSLLELQLAYVQSLGIKKVFINTHHQGQLVQNKITELGMKDVIISHEYELQDIGGGIHRVAEKIGYKGKMLVVNCDQFLWLSLENIKSMQALLSEKNPVVLTSIKVNPKMGYNGIKISSDNQFEGLISGEAIANKKLIDTYGGVCIIDLERITPKLGKSKFFESIVSLAECRAAVWNAAKNEYWDFGTKARFALSHWELISDYNLSTSMGLTLDSNSFLSFLIQQNAILPAKVSSNSYGTDQDECIKLRDMIIARADNKDWEVYSVLQAQLKDPKSKENLLA